MHIQMVTLFGPHGFYFTDMTTATFFSNFKLEII
jgi:hypothetical protein